MVHDAWAGGSRLEFRVADRRVARQGDLDQLRHGFGDHKVLSLQPIVQLDECVRIKTLGWYGTQEDEIQHEHI